MKKIDWIEMAPVALMGVAALGVLITYRSPEPQHSCHGCKECAKIIAEQKKNLETFRRLYEEKGNRFEKHIREATQWQLPLVK